MKKLQILLTVAAGILIFSSCANLKYHQRIGCYSAAESVRNEKSENEKCLQSTLCVPKVDSQACP